VQRSAIRGAVLLVAALLLAVVHIPGRPSTVCTLRALTGVPCPLCGGTTAASAIGHGEVGAALRASPLAVLGAVGYVLGPLGRLPRPSRRVLWAGIGAAAILSELWQLARFGLI
jgi:hypothetical protein